MVTHSAVQFRTSIWKPSLTYLPQAWLFADFRGGSEHSRYKVIPRSITTEGLLHLTYEKKM